MKPDSQNKVANNPDLLAEDVAEYLKANPDFFANHELLLAELTIPHESGKAISLMERQVVLLREQNEELTRQIREFINNANDNDTLFEKTRIVLLELLKSSSLAELSEALTREIGSKFSAIDSKLLFITDQQKENLDCRSVAETMEVLGTLFDKKRTFCGTLKTPQTQFLFPEKAEKIVSTAIVPIHINPNKDNQKELSAIPILVIGSDIPNYFNNTQDTLFLDFIGEVLASIIVLLR